MQGLALMVQHLGCDPFADLADHVRGSGVISGVAPGRMGSAGFGVICSGVASSICCVARAAMASACI